MYKENFPAGSRVRIAEMAQLEKFQRTWRYHHKLEPMQLAYAGKLAEVKAVSFYHGGDVLYELRDIPGTWHEQCLASAQID
ncbi:MAG: hypothetical protein ACTHJS_10825 [Xanthobacteraceae bacterium]|jgi:hypothetical protein